MNEVFFTKKCQYSEKKKRFQFLFFFVCFTIIIETINDFFYAERSGYYVTDALPICHLAVASVIQQYQKIMIAIDGSDEADLAFKKAVNVAKRNDAELLLAHVVDTRSFQSVSSFDGALAEEAMSMAKETLDTYQQQAVDMGQTKVSSVLAYGSPKNIIAKELPKEYNIDLIMLGATGLNAVERLFIGSVSESVIRNASCDVLVVRTDLDNKLPKNEEK